MSDISKVEEIYLAAAEQSDVEQRARYLEEACGDDADLRRRVETLLAAHPHADGFLEPKDPGKTHVYRPSERQSVGTIVANRYTLVEVIGEGGMGTVWRAKQTEPVTRYVALKLIKPGMDSKQVLARFDAERQALAMMDHPNIARILDGGIHENRPYFVMELVKGTPITDFCDARKLTPQQRLELFLPVCHAIQHAHQKGIIHRDIKPSNVLIALYDDKAVPKVIDFGVAKATGGALTQQTIDTGFGGVVGTPQYMSPEQATFNNLDIDTRSDVYSLGTLLYELLAGSPPFAQPELEKRGLLEILRVVREEDPPRPSFKLSTAEARASISANRSIEPAELSSMLQREVDWIVMKALEKDRARRYETANGFAADIQRYLSGEQVQAVPPSFGYRLKKAYRKNRVAVLVGTAFTLLLMCGVAVTSVLAIQARRAQKLADESLQQAIYNQALADAAKDEAIKNRDGWVETTWAFKSMAVESAISANSARIDADLLEYKSDSRLGLLRMARPLKDSVGPIPLPGMGNSTTTQNFPNDPEFVKLRQFQTAAVITGGQYFVPLVPPVETSSPGSPTANTGFVWDETDFAYSPDRTLYAIHSYREGVTLWSLPTFARMGLLCEHDERVLHYGFTHDSKTIWTFDTDSVARFWNIDGSLRAKTPLLPHRFVYPRGLTYRQLRSSISFYGNPPNECFVANGVAILRSNRADWVEHKENGEVTRMTQKAGTEAQPGPVELYSTRTGQFIRRLDHPGRSVSRWQISPDGRWLIYLESVSDDKEEEQSNSADHQVVIVSATDGQELARLDHAWAKPDLSLTVSSMGTWLLAYQHGNTEQVALWRTSDWTKVNDRALDEALAHLDGLTYLSFVTDDILETSSDSTALTGVVQIGKPGSWTSSGTLWSPFGPIRGELGGRLLRQGYSLLSVDPIQRLVSPHGRKFHSRLAELAQDGRFWGRVDTETDRMLPANSLFEEPNFESEGFSSFSRTAECKGRYFSGYGTVGVTRTNDSFELRILPDPKKLDIPPEMLELWAQVITGGELAADGGFKPWHQPTWEAKQKQLAAMKPPYPDFPFPGWAATEPNLWYRIQANRALKDAERQQLLDEWRRRTGRIQYQLEPDTWRTPEVPPIISESNSP